MHDSAWVHCSVGREFESLQNYSMWQFTLHWMSALCKNWNTRWAASFLASTLKFQRPLSNYCVFFSRIPWTKKKITHSYKKIGPVLKFIIQVEQIHHNTMKVICPDWKITALMSIEWHLVAQQAIFSPFNDTVAFIAVSNVRCSNEVWLLLHGLSQLCIIYIKNIYIIVCIFVLIAWLV